MHLAEIVLANGFALLVALACCYAIESPRGGNVLLVGLTLFVAAFVTYALHKAAHTLPWLRALAHPHLSGHHSRDKRAERTRTLTAEALFNLATSGFLLIPLVYLLRLQRILYPRTIAVFALAYTITHLIQYHADAGSHVHRLHHRNDGRCNYGPDFADHLFGTSCDGTVENTTLYSVNAVVAALLVAGCALS